MLPPELIDRLRIDRYRQVLNLPSSIKLAISPLDRTLLISAPLEQLERLQNNIVSLRMQAWFIAAACQISLFCNNDLVYRASTQLQPVKNIAELRGITVLEEPMVATATRPASRTAPKATQPASSAAIPTVKSLANLARNTGLSEETIAAEIIDLGKLAFYDSEAGTYKADEAGINAWADAWLDRDRETRKAQLFSDEPANGKVETHSEPIAATPTEGQPAAPTKTRKPRLRDFAPAKSYAKAVGNFLEAQNWDTERRTELIEQLAQLLDEPGDSNSLAEAAMSKILSKYPAAEHSSRRKAIIKAIKTDILGKQVESEPEAVATE